MNKSTTISMILEFVDNGAILEYPDQGVKYVVEEKDGEPYNSIGEDIQQAITGIEVSNRYRISITIEAI
ncbi:MAG: hypothetical protein IJE18_06260 [Bacteroidaceae bacterium]|nr:hypothetical protein [Bacteroidaceae bacterium]MBQ3196537.1 hypothetical protein [Alistipes sp.]